MTQGQRDEIGIWHVSFCGGGKSEKPQENPWRKVRTNNKHKWLIMLGPESEPGHSGGRVHSHHCAIHAPWDVPLSFPIYLLIYYYTHV